MTTKQKVMLAGAIAILLILYFTRDKIKEMIVTNIPTFIQKFLPLAKVAAATFGFKDPYFLLSQMYAENAGNSFLLNNANNVGSLISRSDGIKKLPTNEYWKGEEIPNTKNGLWFRKYPTLQDGFLDYARTLSKYYALNTVSTIGDYANKISNSAYIDEKNGDNRTVYANNIVNTYNKLKSA